MNSTISGRDPVQRSVSLRGEFGKTGRSGLLIILICTALLNVTGAALHRTSATTETYFGTIQALVEHNTFALDETEYAATIDRVLARGHYYTHKPLLLPLIGAAV